MEMQCSGAGKLDFPERDPLLERYVIVSFSFDGKLVRAFPNVPELPPIYPKSETLWSATIEASQMEMQKKEDH